jgi:hypothetical protein
MTSENYFNPFGTDYDTSELDSDGIHEGGGSSVALEGFYHVQVADVSYTKYDISEGGSEPTRVLPQVKIIMQVLEGDHASEKGKNVYHTIYLAKWADRESGEVEKLQGVQLKGVIAFLHAFGTIGEEVFGRPSVKINLDMFSRLEGLQAIVRVSQEAESVNKETGVVYPARCKIRWNTDVFPIDHKRVEGVNVDRAAIQYLKTGKSTDTGIESVLDESIESALDDI